MSAATACFAGWAADRNLLFGVLALQLDLIDGPRFAEACAAWAARSGVELADVLLERGWLTPADKADVDRLLERKLKRGAIPTSLAGLVHEDAHRVLQILCDPAVNRTLAGLSLGGEDATASLLDPPANNRGHFLMLRLHAVGGIGQVWLARDDAVGRDVALKELRPDRNGEPAAVARFLTEVRITGQLEHPGVVPVYELLPPSAGQQACYAMRFIKGQTLSAAASVYHRRRSGGTANPLDLRALLNAFVAVCNTLAYAHARGVIHRDLKGANVVLGDYGEVMVVDWGLAKVVGGAEAAAGPPVTLPAGAAAGETLPGHVIGTPAYMPPEQAGGHAAEVGPLSDVYGLGAILYEILTGQPPFAGADVSEVLSNVVRQQPTPPRRVWPGVPRPLEAVCLRALAKQPADRYASAADLARDVQRWLADEPVSAYREPWTGRLWRAARHHKPLVTGAAALVATALTALVVGLILLGREKARTETARAQAVANFRKARDVLNTFYGQLGKDYLLNEPGLQPLRKELARQALAFHDDFVREQGDDPDVRADKGESLLALADITNDTGEKPEAVNLAGKALALFEGLAREHPVVADYRRAQARCHLKLGAFFYGVDDLSGSETAFRQGQDVYQRLLNDAPPNAADQNGLGVCANNLALLHLRKGKFDDARTSLTDALRVRENLARADPGNATYQRNLADSYSLRAELAARTNHGEQAEADCATVLRIRQKLVDGHPKVIEYQNCLAAAYNNQGMVYRELGRRAEAERSQDEGLTIRLRLVAQNPALTLLQRDLANSYRSLGGLYLGDLQKAATEAEKDRAFRNGRARYQSALEVSRKLADSYPQERAFQIDVGLDCSNLANLCYYHHPRDAVPWYDEALRILEGVPEELRLPEVRKAIGDCHWGRADILGGAGDYEHALADWQRALKTYSGPDAAALRSDARAFAERLRPLLCDAVLAATGSLATANLLPSKPDVAYQLATVYSLLAASVHRDQRVASEPREDQSAWYAAQVVELLRRAKAAGYFNDPVHHDRLAKDADLDALRPRADFQELLGPG
jgi:serine/threonine-protein kinase